MTTDPLWCYENYEAAAECIDQQENKITEANKRIAEIESDNKIYAECNAELKATIDFLLCKIK